MLQVVFKSSRSLANPTNIQNHERQNMNLLAEKQSSLRFVIIDPTNLTHFQP